MRTTFSRLIVAAALAMSGALPSIPTAHAETACSFNEIEIDNGNPPADLTVGFCDAIAILTNVSGIRPTVSEPSPGLASTDGRDEQQGSVLAGDFMPLRLDRGHYVRIVRIVPMREGTAEITFYNFDGSVRHVTKVIVKP